MRVEGGAYKMKGAADTPNSPNWKEIGIIQTKYNWETPNLVMTGKVDESTIMKEGDEYKFIYSIGSQILSSARLQECW